MGWASYNEDIESRAIGDLRQAAAQRLVGAREQQSPCSPIPSGGTPEPSQSSRRLREFVLPSPRPLPVFVLADVSGTMAVNGKIEALNRSIKDMIAAFAEEEEEQAEIHVCVITFGGPEAKIDGPLMPASTIVWEDMVAAGKTPMGGAFRLVRQLIEDNEVVPSRAYRPAIVLVSDGIPNDDWRSPLDGLLASERCSKAARFALAIGEDADVEMLQAFLHDEKARVFEAQEAPEIKRFFRWVTMSVTQRSRSITPDALLYLPETNLDELDF